MVVVANPFGVVIEQVQYALAFGGLYDKADVVRFAAHAPHQFRVVELIGIRPFLAGQGDDDTGVIFTGFG